MFHVKHSAKELQNSVFSLFHVKQYEFIEKYDDLT